MMMQMLIIYIQHKQQFNYLYPEKAKVVHMTLNLMKSCFDH